MSSGQQQATVQPWWIGFKGGREGGREGGRRHTKQTNSGRSVRSMSSANRLRIEVEWHHSDATPH